MLHVKIKTCSGFHLISWLSCPVVLASVETNYIACLFKYVTDDVALSCIVEKF
jgi:hypothetical protein